jgi:hypothetical protein
MSHRHRVHPRGILARLLERLRGREQLLVRVADDLPLLLLSYPRGGLSVAREIEVACAHTLPRLSAESRLTKRLAAEAEQEEEL